MHKVEAYNLLAEHIAYMTDYDECARRIESDPVSQFVAKFVVTGQSGIEFRVRLECCWEGKPSGSIRVFGTIGYTDVDGLVELTQALIVDPISLPPPTPSQSPGFSARQ